METGFEAEIVTGDEMIGDEEECQDQVTMGENEDEVCGAHITDKSPVGGSSYNSPEPIEINSTASEGEGEADEVEEVKNDIDNSMDTAQVVEEDLEEGECTSDEEAVVPLPAPAAPVPVKKSVSKEPEEKERRRHKDSGKRSHRSRSRDRHRDRGKGKKRRKEKVVDEISAEEAKRRAVLRKLKALESDMGLDYEEEYSEEGTPAATEDSDTEPSDSRSRSSSPASPRKKDKKRKRERQEREREHKRRKNDQRQMHKMHMKKSEKLCHLFMQGKCPRPAHDCFYSHDAEPPQVWELCKFYLFDRCAKRDKCLYLHKGFPCKYFHTGKHCPDDRITCKFSHDPLNDTTRTLLLKHIEAAPKEILGDFQRMTRPEAADCIFQTEAKNKGWSTEGPDAVMPPVVEEEEGGGYGHGHGHGFGHGHGHGLGHGHGHGVNHGHGLGHGNGAVQGQEAVAQHLGDVQGSASGVVVAAPSHLKLDPIQEKLLKMQGMGTSMGSSMGGGGHPPPMPPMPLMGRPVMGAASVPTRWEGGSPGNTVTPAGPPAPSREPPLAVQQALAMEGRAGPPQQQSGVQGHSVRNNGAFNNQGSMRRVTSGLLGPPPDTDEESSRGPTDLMDITIDEKEVVGFLNKQRQEASHAQESEAGAWTPVGGKETSEGSPPSLPRERTPSPVEKEEMPRMPKAQLKLYQRIQQKQRERTKSDDQERPPPVMDKDDNWYSDEEEMEKKPESPKKSPKEAKPPLGAPFALSSLNLPPELTNVLTAISQKSSCGSSPVNDDGSLGTNKRFDPRKVRMDPRRQDKRDHEAEEREKDQRLMELDLGSVFGDLELPPLAPSPPHPTEQEESLTKALGLPFKPHIMYVAKEIDASIASHAPLDWVLVPIEIHKPDLSDLKQHFTSAQMEADPRLRKIAKSNSTKLKEISLPSFPAPKSDPRLAKTKSVAAPVSAPTIDRRRSSEDSEGGKVYNPAKELTKARQMQVRGKDSEVYSPSQEQEYFSPNQEQQGGFPGRKGEEPPYNPGFDESMEFQGEMGDPRNYPGPYDYPPRGGPGGPWQGGPHERRGGHFHRGGPPRGHHNDERFPPHYDNYGMGRDFPPREGNHRGGPSMGHPHRGGHMDHGHRGPPMDHPPYFDGPERDFGGPGHVWKNGMNHGGQRRPNHGGSPHGDYRGGRGGSYNHNQSRKKDPRRRDMD